MRQTKGRFTPWTRLANLLDAKIIPPRKQHSHDQQRGSLYITYTKLERSDVFQVSLPDSASPQSPLEPFFTFFSLSNQTTFTSILYGLGITNIKEAL